jgi:hypothetical protein
MDNLTNEHLALLKTCPRNNSAHGQFASRENYKLITILPVKLKQKVFATMKTGVPRINS